MSFVGDCPDVALLEDVLSALQEALHHGSPTHQPLISCLEMHGGERLFMSLLQREQQSLRLLGLQIMTAFQNNLLLPQPALFVKHGAELIPSLSISSKFLSPRLHSMMSKTKTQIMALFGDDRRSLHEAVSPSLHLKRNGLTTPLHGFMHLSQNDCFSYNG